MSRGADASRIPGKGLYRKYEVKRLHDRKKKHANCRYFVLDLVHDRFAMQALTAYADACEAEYPDLADDLRGEVAEMHGRLAAAEDNMSDSQEKTK